jgi:hypothetical protein
VAARQHDEEAPHLRLVLDHHDLAGGSDSHAHLRTRQ